MVNCRFCNAKTKLIYDFGDMVVSGFIKPGDEIKKSPLTIVSCTECGLVQLGDTPDLDYLYKEHYWYKSALNSSMLVALKDIVDNIEKRIELKYGNIVVDIGANDCSLFTFYTNKNLYKVGFDPAPNLEESANKNSTWFVNDYFTADKYPYANEKAKVVTSIAMFYDLPDPNKFIEDVKSVLDENGIWVIQLTDLTSMIKLNEFTSFCHEHLEFYKLLDLVRMLNKHGLEIFDLEYNNTNGGSLRVYVGYADMHEIDMIVYKTLEDEIAFYDGKDRLQLMFDKMDNIKTVLVEYMNSIREQGNDIYALGASTKGSTLCQYLGIDNKLITAIGEVNPDKYGLVTSGTNIPIVSEEEMLKKNPKYVFLIIWQFEENILCKLQDHIENGLEVIIPLPTPHITSYQKITQL